MSNDLFENNIKISLLLGNNAQLDKSVNLCN